MYVEDVEESDDPKSIQNIKKKIMIISILAYRNINKLLIYIAIGLNGIAIATMIFNYNFGIFFFFINLYLIFLLYLRIRKEDKKARAH